MAFELHEYVVFERARWSCGDAARTEDGGDLVEAAGDVRFRSIQAQAFEGDPHENPGVRVGDSRISFGFGFFE